MIKNISVIALIAILAFSCQKDEEPEPMEEMLNCDEFMETYDNGIKAIIDNNCATSGCHDGKNPRPDFTDYQNVFENRNGIKSRVVGKSMPPSNRTPLSQSDIDKIDCWVTNGAPE